MQASLLVSRCTPHRGREPPIRSGSAALSRCKMGIPPPIGTLGATTTAAPSMHAILESGHLVPATDYTLRCDARPRAAAKVVSGSFSPLSYNVCLSGLSNSVLCAKTLVFFLTLFPSFRNCSIHCLSPDRLDYAVFAAGFLVLVGLYREMWPSGISLRPGDWSGWAPAPGLTFNGHAHLWLHRPTGLLNGPLSLWPTLNLRSSTLTCLRGTPLTSYRLRHIALACSLSVCMRESTPAGEGSPKMCLPR